MLDMTPAAIAQMIVTYGWPGAFALMLWMYREEAKKREQDRKEHDLITALKDKQLLELSEKTATGLANANQNSAMVLAILSSPRK